MSRPALRFTCGANLPPPHLRRRPGLGSVVAAASLDGWRLRFHKRDADGSAKAAIEPTAYTTAHGLLRTSTPSGASAAVTGPRR